MAKHVHSSTLPRVSAFVSHLALLLVLVPLWASAQVQNVQLQGATATQAIFSFDVPDPTNCQVVVSTDPNFGSVVNDTNTALFPGSQNCNRTSSSVTGSHVTFVAGTRTSRAGSDGAFYSLALEANRVHYYRITSRQDVFTCDPAMNCIKTAVPPFGNTFPEPPPFDSTAPYNYAWPTIRPGLDRNTPFVDPLTGIPAMPISGPSQGTNNLGPIANSARSTQAFDTAQNGNWTNLASGAALDGQVASDGGANQDPLFIRFAPWCIALGTGFVSPAGTIPFGCGIGQGTWGILGGDQTYVFSIDDMQVQVALSGTGATTQAQIALTVDGVHPATDWETLGIGGSNTNIHFPADAYFPSTLKGTGNNRTVFGYWFSNQVRNLLTRPDLQPHTGSVSIDTSGNVTWGSGEKFRVSSLSAGSQIVLSSGPSIITNVSPGAGGLVRLTIANHGLFSGDSFFLIGLMGSNGVNMALPGAYQVSVIDANTVDLIGTAFPTGVTFSSGSGYRESFYAITAINSPISVTISGAPPAGTYRYMAWNVGVLVRKASSTGGTLRVDGATYTDYESTMGQMPISGLVDVCAVNTVTDSHGIVVRPCMFLEGFEHLFYAIEETTGKARFIGAGDPLGCITGLCAAGVNNHANDYRNYSIPSNGSTFSTDPRHWLGGGVDTGNNFVIIDLAYNPGGTASCPNDWQEITPANCPTYPKNNNVAETNVTPKVDPQGRDQTPVRQMVNYNAAQMLRHPEIPVFDPARWNVAVGVTPTDQTKGWFAVQFITAQNYLGWIGFFDPAANFSLVAMNNSYSSYNCRYCGSHGAWSLAGIEGASVVVVPAGSGPGTGRFVLQSNTSADNLTQNVCSGIADPNFTSFNGQSRCYDLALAGPDPCHDTPNLATEINPMYQPCTWHAGWTSMTRMNVIVGDLLDDTNDVGEMFRVVKVNGNTITVIRAYGTPAVTVGENARQSSLQAHTAPWLLREYCSGTTGSGGGQSWFDLNADPNGLNAIVDYPTLASGHLDYWTTGAFAEPPRYRIYSSISAMLNQPTSFHANLEGSFGSYLSGGTNFIQTHAGVSRDSSNPYYTIDKNPYSSISSATNTLWNQTADNMTGALWHIAAANVQKDPNTPWPGGIKSVPYVMWSGGYLLQDVSGPASAITGTAGDNWKFCVVYAAGECTAGSAIGDVYVNIPQSAHDGKCGPWDYSRNICGTTLDHVAAGLNQYDFSGIPLGQSLNITDGRTYRRLGGLFNRLNFESVFSSGHSSFGGQWAFGHADYYGGGLRTDLFLVKLPPAPPSDHTPRNDFVDVPVMLGANAAPNARIRFGYAENGPVGAFYCAYNRKDVCYTNPNRTAAIPYFFKNEPSQVFQSCSAGCTIHIPAIPGRVVYYVVERLDASGNVADAGGLPQVQWVP